MSIPPNFKKFSVSDYCECKTTSKDYIELINKDNTKVCYYCNNVCCYKAIPLACVCLYSWKCDYHKRQECYGSHS